MARLIRPLRQWPQLQHHCYSGSPINDFFSSVLLPTITTKQITQHCLTLAPLPSSHRNSHHRSRALRPVNAPAPVNFKEDDTTSDSESDSKKSRNQRKREARLAVRWGMQLAAFTTPQIKRILSIASLGEETFEALMLVKRLGHDVKEGKRRQYNYIGKLLRDADPELMEASIQATKDGDHSTLQALAAASKAQIVVDDDGESEETESEEEEEESHEYINIATRWFNGLIDKDIEITKEVYSLQSVDFDRQELRKLVKRVHASQEDQTIIEGNEGKVDATIIRAKNSLTRFLRTLAQRYQMNDI